MSCCFGERTHEIMWVAYRLPPGVTELDSDASKLAWSDGIGSVHRHESFWSTAVRA